MEKQEIKKLKTQDLRTFGRRHGKKLSNRKQWLIDNLLPEMAPNAKDLSGESVILEIGFGNGEHLRDLALNNPDKIIIGAEPFANGVAGSISSNT